MTEAAGGVGDRDVSVAIDLEVVPRLHSVLEQNDVPAVPHLRVENPTGEDLHDLELTVEIGDVAEPFRRKIDRLPARSSRELAPVPIDLLQEVLKRRTERERLDAVARVVRQSAAGPEELAETRVEVEVFPFREWPGLGLLPELIAGFVTPNDSGVAPLLKPVSDALKRLTGHGALDGYVSRDRSRARSITAAVFEVLRALELAYALPPASFEQHGQKIRRPSEVVEHRVGTCLDLAILAASLLEQLGLHALLVFVEGHAFVGAWTVEQTFAECVVRDGLRLRKRADLGDLVLFEATAVTESDVSFERAEKLARAHLDDLDRYHCSVDVAQSRRLKVRPLASESAAPRVELPGEAAIDLAPQEEPAVPPPAQASVPSPAPEESDEAVAFEQEGRIGSWKRRLLDLTLRNRMLNFRPSRKTIPLLAPGVAALEDAFSSGRWFTFAPKPEELDDGERDASVTEARTGEDPVLALVAEELAEGRLRADLGADELDRRLLEVFRTARLGLEETGANSLYLSVGMLRWFESESSKDPRLAPLLLLPIEIERMSAREGFRIRLADEEPQVNVTLLEKLRVDYGVDVEGLEELPEDEEGLDVETILGKLRRAVLSLSGAEVVDEAWIGVFSFTKFMMWRDLQARSGELLRNAVLQHLVERPGASFEPDAEFPRPEELDEAFAPKDAPCPLDADSSQLAAALAACDGRSFVLEGPPGTGKSQTITNLIALCLAQGKRVLFVAEKRAALSVVRERLGRIGLDPFCLELHSNKSSKREVLDSLAESMETAGARSPKEWSTLASDLLEERQALNHYVETIHEERATGESLFDTTAQLVHLRETRRVPLQIEDPSEIGEEWIRARRRAIESAVAALREVGLPTEHPLRELGGMRWSSRVVDDGLAAIATTSESCDVFAGALREAAARLDLPDDQVFPGGAAEELAALATLLLSAPAGVSRALCTEPDWSTVRERSLQVLEQAREAHRLRTHVATQFRATVLELPLESLRDTLQKAASSIWPISWLRARGARAQLKVHATGSLASNVELAQRLGRAIESREAERALAAPGHEGPLWFGDLHWRSGQLDEAQVDALREAVEWAGRLRSVLRRALDLLPGEATERFRERVLALVTRDRDLLREGAVHEGLVSLCEAADGFRDQRDELRGALQIATDPLAPETGEPWLETAASRLERWAGALRDSLREWTWWIETRGELTDLDLTPLVDRIEAGELDPDDVAPAFERSWRESFWNATHDSEEALRRFHGPDHERRIQRFRDLDHRQIDLASEWVHARLAARVPEMERVVSDASEVGLLQRELRKKRRHLPIRRLIQQIPHLLPRLKPCFLMSPLSVAQYLDAGETHFDVVVFDEASQIAPWDAVGAIARGTSCVVVGDSKQLPPTSFFQSVDDEDFADDEDVEDLESVLDEFGAAGFRSLRLAWHYRSRHESLIAFSNHHYYGNELLTFPSPDEEVEGLGVRFVHVPDGVYDRSQSRTNRAEADSIVSELVRRVRQNPDESVGVVTFSMAQRELIENLLDKMRRDEPALERVFSDAVEEPVFVKNLENVQGDERDVILFSVGYGPDAAGKVSMHFGPLNLQGGERRLNVAVTRARREVVVHSTLRSEQIDLRRTQALGVRHLKNFLDYAERGAVALSAEFDESMTGEAESPFEAQVAARLRERGHDIAFQVGCSGYRIDLAVRDPEAPGRFLIGIECDGAAYHSARTARDRDRLREAVLRGLGWELCRVWSTDWWRHPAREIERIEQAIEAARRQARARGESRLAQSSVEPVPEVSEPTAEQERERFAAPPSSVSPEAAPAPSESEGEIESDAAPEPDPEPDAPVEAEVPAYSTYVEAELGSLGSRDDFFDPGSDEAVHRVLTEIFRVEAPIAESLLQRRIAAAFEVRFTARARTRLADLVASMPSNVRPVCIEGFYWRSDQDPEEWQGFRVPADPSDEPRAAEEIPAEEVAEAVALLIEHAIAMPAKDLVREVGKRFGYARLGSRVESAMRRGVDRAVVKGRIVRREDDTLAHP